MLASPHMKHSSTSTSTTLSSSSCTEMVTRELPEDVLINIVRRLPYKDFIRFTITSKSWLSMLASPQFWVPKNTPNFHLFKHEPYYLSENKYARFSLYNTTHSLEDLHSRFKVPFDQNLSIVCSASGLICLFDLSLENPIMSSLWLFNPCIRKSLIVPSPNPCIVSNSSPNVMRFIFGCGYHSDSNDYKVVRVEYFKGDTGDSDHVSFLTRVYSVKESRWKCLGMSSLPLNIVRIRYRGEFIEGVFHWSCEVKVGSMFRWSILTLKLGNESGEFGEIKLPPNLLAANPRTIRVARFPNGMSGEDSLAIVHGEGEIFLAVWIMREYGVEGTWFMKFNIWLGGMGLRDDMNVVFLRKKALLLQSVTVGWIVCYPARGYLIPTPIPDNFEFVDNHVESTVLLGQREVGQCSYGNVEC